MDSKIIKISEISNLIHEKKYRFKELIPMGLFALLLLLWCLVPGWLRQLNRTVGDVDQSILLLVILSLICFLLITALSWWLLQRFWLLLKLPPLKFMVLQFNTLTLWQQLSFFWASFALLLLAALGCLTAIC